MPKKKATRKTGYQSDVSDEEWAFCAPYLTLMNDDAPQRDHALRAVFNALRYMVRAGCPWRMIPNDLPPWHAVYDQTQRWIKAGVFEALAHDLRKMLRPAGRARDAAFGRHPRWAHGAIDAGERSPRRLRWL
jgi:transposase